MILEDAKTKDILAYTPESPAPEPTSAPPSVNDQIGRALSRIGNYNDLDNTVTIYYSFSVLMHE
jgi:hypothetical protein